MSGVLFRQNGGPWSSPSNSGYSDENELVSMITEFPELLPGVSEDSFVCREFETPSGPIDILIINAKNGAITIVECKLAKNPEVRRKIVGQIIDYAASLRSLSFANFHNKWIDRGGPNLESLVVGESPLSLLVSDNLESSRFTLLLAVDEINEPLKQMTVYVNEKTDSTTRVALIELARHSAHGVEVVIPQTFGYEANKPDLDPYAARKAWTQDDFKAWLLNNEPESLRLFESLMEKLASIECGWGGTKAATPSGVAQFRSGKSWRYPLSFHTFNDATLEVAFADMQRFDFMEEWLELFSEVDEINPTLIRSKNFGAYPKIPIKRLGDPIVMNAVVAACLMAKQRS